MDFKKYLKQVSKKRIYAYFVVLILGALLVFIVDRNNSSVEDYRRDIRQARIKQECSFNLETVCYDDSLRDILPIKPVDAGNIPDIVADIRQYKAENNRRTCELLLDVKPLSGTKFDDIGLVSPNGRNWFHYCRAIVNSDAAICEDVEDKNYSSSGGYAPGGVTLPNLNEECIAYFNLGI